MNRKKVKVKVGSLIRLKDEFLSGHPDVLNQEQKFYIVEKIEVSDFYFLNFSPWSWPTGTTDKEITLYPEDFIVVNE